MPAFSRVERCASTTPQSQQVLPLSTQVRPTCGWRRCDCVQRPRRLCVGVQAQQHRCKSQARHKEPGCLPHRFAICPKRTRIVASLRQRIGLGHSAGSGKIVGRARQVRDVLGKTRRALPHLCAHAADQKHKLLRHLRHGRSCFLQRCTLGPVGGPYRHAKQVASIASRY